MLPTQEQVDESLQDAPDGPPVRRSTRVAAKRQPSGPKTTAAVSKTVGSRSAAGRQKASTANPPTARSIRSRPPTSQGSKAINKPQSPKGKRTRPPTPLADQANSESRLDRLAVENTARWMPGSFEPVLPNDAIPSETIAQQALPVTSPSILPAPTVSVVPHSLSSHETPNLLSTRIRQDHLMGEVETATTHQSTADTAGIPGSPTFPAILSSPAGISKPPHSHEVIQESQSIRQATERLAKNQNTPSSPSAELESISQPGGVHPSNGASTQQSVLGRAFHTVLETFSNARAANPKPPTTTAGSSGLTTSQGYNDSLMPPTSQSTGSPPISTPANSGDTHSSEPRTTPAHPGSNGLVAAGTPFIPTVPAVNLAPVSERDNISVKSRQRLPQSGHAGLGYSPHPIASSSKGINGDLGGFSLSPTQPLYSPLAAAHSWGAVRYDQRAFLLPPLVQPPLQRAIGPSNPIGQHNMFDPQLGLYRPVPQNFQNLSEGSLASVPLQSAHTKKAAFQASTDNMISAASSIHTSSKASEPMPFSDSNGPTDTNLSGMDEDINDSQPEAEPRHPGPMAHWRPERERTDVVQHAKPKPQLKSRNNFEAEKLHAALRQTAMEDSSSDSSSDANAAPAKCEKGKARMFSPERNQRASVTSAAEDVGLVVPSSTSSKSSPSERGQQLYHTSRAYLHEGTSGSETEGPGPTQRMNLTKESQARRSSPNAGPSVPKNPRERGDPYVSKLPATLKHPGDRTNDKLAQKQRPGADAAGPSRPRPHETTKNPHTSPRTADKSHISSPIAGHTTNGARTPNALPSHTSGAPEKLKMSAGGPSKHRKKNREIKLLAVVEQTMGTMTDTVVSMQQDQRQFIQFLMSRPQPQAPRPIPAPSSRDPQPHQPTGLDDDDDDDTPVKLAGPTQHRSAEQNDVNTLIRAAVRKLLKMKNARSRLPSGPRQDQRKPTEDLFKIRWSETHTSPWNTRACKVVSKYMRSRSAKDLHGVKKDDLILQISLHIKYLCAKYKKQQTVQSDGEMAEKAAKQSAKQRKRNDFQRRLEVVSFFSPYLDHLRRYLQILGPSGMSSDELGPDGRSYLIARQEWRSRKIRKVHQALDDLHLEFIVPTLRNGNRPRLRTMGTKLDPSPFVPKLPLDAYSQNWYDGLSEGEQDDVKPSNLQSSWAVDVKGHPATRKKRATKRPTVYLEEHAGGGGDADGDAMDADVWEGCNSGVGVDEDSGSIDGEGKGNHESDEDRSDDEDADEEDADEDDSDEDDSEEDDSDDSDGNDAHD